jgi:hypothetical protein
MRGSFYFTWLLAVVLVAQCFSVKLTFFARLFSKPVPKLPELHTLKMCVSPIKNPETERDVKANEMDLGGISTKDELTEIEEKDATKSDHEIMEEKSASSMRDENVTASIKMLTMDLIRNFGLPTLKEITSAWMTQHISETKNILVESDTFKSDVIKAPNGGYLFFKKSGKGVKSIALDCYSLEPVHAIGECKVGKNPSLLEAADLFVRKVKCLKDKEARESFPLAFFCVEKLDLHLLDEIMDTLKEVDGVLLANIHKCYPYVETSKMG